MSLEKNTNDKFAERRKVNKQFTPIRGSWVVRVSNKQWIEVQWDKTNNYIHLILPPNTHQNRSKFPIYITRKNWHITKDLPPKEVTVEYCSYKDCKINNEQHEFVARDIKGDGEITYWCRKCPKIEIKKPEENLIVK